MTFPHISVRTTNFTLTPKMETLLEQKLSPLGKFLGERNEAYCEVELEKVAEHQSGKIYRAEVNLQSGGRLFRVEATEEQIEQSIDSVRDQLRNELQHAHGKRQSLVRRGGQALKSMLRFGR